MRTPSEGTLGWKRAVQGRIWSLLADQELCDITNCILRLVVTPGFVTSNVYTSPGPWGMVGEGDARQDPRLVGPP